MVTKDAIRMSIKRALDMLPDRTDGRPYLHQAKNSLLHAIACIEQDTKEVSHEASPSR